MRVIEGSEAFVYYTVCEPFQRIKPVGNVAFHVVLNLLQLRWRHTACVWCCPLRLSPTTSLKHLELCQQQMLIKPRVLGPRTMYLVNYKHSFIQVVIVCAVLCTTKVNLTNSVLLASLC